MNGREKMITLEEAPGDALLRLVKVIDRKLADSMLRMGLSQGSTLVKVDKEEIVRQSVRVKGTKGGVVLGGGMSAKIMVQKADGTKAPVAQLERDDEGEIVALSGGPGLHDTLQTLGLKIGDRVRLLRKLPPMIYLLVVDRKARVRIQEGVAAKIWGVMDARTLQFTSARVDKEFKVLKTLGGTRVKGYLSILGIDPGVTLVLQGIEQGKRVSYGPKKHLAIDTQEGLRIYFGSKEASLILVDPVE